MSDKKIFIALSQREARSVITAINFLTEVCLPKSRDIFQEVKQKNAESIGITAEELSELFNFGFRLVELADQQAELEATIQQQATSNQNPETSIQP